MRTTKNYLLLVKAFKDVYEHMEFKKNEIFCVVDQTFIINYVV